MEHFKVRARPLSGFDLRTVLKAGPFRNRLQIDLVCHGKTRIGPDADGSDPYEEPKRANKFKIIDSGNSMTTEKLIQRIINRRIDFEDRNVRKEAKERAAFETLQQSKLPQ